MSVKLSKLIEEVSEKSIMNFPLILNGQAYAKTKKRLARLSISIPQEIIGGDLSDKDKWWFRIIAIEKKEYERAYKKLEPELQEKGKMTKSKEGEGEDK